VGVEIRRRLQRPHDYVYPGNVWSRVQCFQTVVTECREPGSRIWGSWCAKIETASGSAAFASEMLGSNGRTVLDDVQANADGNEWKCS
jgi:hypothetical protein